MAVATETFVYTEMPIAVGDRLVSIPAAYPKGDRKRLYLPFRIMCHVVGVERKRQLAIVKRDYAKALRMLPLETEAGVRPALWMLAGDCALWVGKLDPDRTSLKNRDNLLAFQEALRDAAQRILFEGAHKPPSQRGMFAFSQRMEYVFSCLACGAGHRIIAQNGEVTLERYEY
jgi:hypothetical protein